MSLLLVASPSCFLGLAAFVWPWLAAQWFHRENPERQWWLSWLRTNDRPYQSMKVLEDTTALLDHKELNDYIE
jgi:hypothetical protein